VDPGIRQGAEDSIERELLIMAGTEEEPSPAGGSNREREAEDLTART